MTIARFYRTSPPKWKGITAGSHPIQPFERNTKFTNPLVHSTSLYLRQHAHNPVFWYPWGKEAIDRARNEKKPIFLSIGYSSCYWCHVMERDVFENLSIASLINRFCINIKVDREELPQLDDIYMVARQLLTHEGGWPNNLFLTPELKPFYAGGTYGAGDTYGKPGFPRILEWLNYVWTTQNEDVYRIADRIVADMKPYLVYQPPEVAVETHKGRQVEDLVVLLKKHHDERAGGFFQAPKFPHECYLQFLTGYYEATGSLEALDIVTRSLERMAIGGIYDQVGCGFHRYAVDKEWYIPHFEKMLYNQAQLARLYVDAARLSGNPFLADVARGVLEFVGGPLTSGTGGFYASIDAETDGVEGAHYAWSAEELKTALTPEEIRFLTAFYALADIPSFPGHKHVDGQVLIARKPFDQAAREAKMPYVQLAALTGQLMNKLLHIRNRRPAPRIDDKIIVSWNGLMIDAFAHAGKVLERPGYTARAREAADFLLEHAIDKQGRLRRIFAGGRAQFDATLEDYAFLIKGLLSLWRVTPDAILLEAAQSLCAQADELFADGASGYFFTQASEEILFRIKSGDDGAMPNANAVMLHNLIDLYGATQEKSYLDRAQGLADFFLQGNTQLSVEYATMLHGALRLEALTGSKEAHAVPQTFKEARLTEDMPAPDDSVSVSATLFPADAAPGTRCEVIITLDIREGWHINAHQGLAGYLIPTQVDVQGNGVEIIAIGYPEPLRRDNRSEGEALLVYEGLVTITARIKLPAADKKTGQRAPLRVMARFQPCRATACHAIRDIVVTL
jgi:uncharacterized protein